MGFFYAICWLSN